MFENEYSLSSVTEQRVLGLGGSSVNVEKYVYFWRAPPVNRRSGRLRVTSTMALTHLAHISLSSSCNIHAGAETK